MSREPRLVNALAFAVLTAGMLIVLFKCSEGPLTLPDQEFQLTTTVPPIVEPPPAPDEPNECDVVGLKRAGIRWRLTAGHILILTVPVTPAFGEPYVNVWLPEVNHQLLARCPANSECRVRLPGKGPWSLRLAAETRDADGKVYQCDRAQLEIPVPPPPTTTVPRCGVKPMCEVTVSTMGDDWSKAHWKACDYVGEVVFQAKWDTERGPRVKTKRFPIDVGCDCVEGSKGLDTKGPGAFKAWCE